MDLVYPNCAGMDVHKASVKVCVVWRDSEGKRQQKIEPFTTMTRDLLRMRDWLAAHNCTIIAMESTGVYWKPIFNLLSDDFEVMLVNPSHLKRVKGRKTDVQDAEWLGQLLEHGLVEPSFIPPVEIRDLRDLTRYRRRLIQERSSEMNRVQKILEDANIKLGVVATDVFGVSGRAMLAAMLEGKKTPEEMADMAKGRLRNKHDELLESLNGRFRPHHVMLLKEMMKHIEFLDEAIELCDSSIEDLLRPFVEKVELLDGITGVDQRAAQDIIAEVGTDMATFPTHKHLCSWAKICPGNNESGGKRLSGKIGKGNKWLRAILVQCGQAAGHSRDTYLGAQFARLAPRKGKQRAAVAVGHSILEAVFFILRDNVPYHELGPTHFDNLNKDHIIRSYRKRLEGLGYLVELREAPVAA